MSIRDSDLTVQRGGRHIAQVLAGVFGAIYLLIGILGFFITGFANFAGVTDKTLLGFEVNPLHNIAHILVGVLGLAMMGKLASARMYGWILAVAYGALFLFGLFAAGNDDVNFLSLNGADNVLHLLTAIVGVVIATIPDRRTASA